MDTQRRTRRTVLGAVLAALALPGLHATAAVSGPFDYDSREQFEGECHDIGGTFIDTGDGNLWCQGPDGGQTVCDANGQDCYHIPVRHRPSGTHAPLPGSGGLATTGSGGALPTAPVAHQPSSGTVSATAARAGFQRAAPEQASRQSERARTTHVAKHGKRHKHGTKRHPW